jgi:murein DD-endopeptidase MepM/ murein hydrolase activator NlpD
MAYPHTYKLDFPLKKYEVNSYKFKQKCTYGKVCWGVHLGEDINIKAGTAVKSIGRGKVVYSKLHAGTQKKANWGNIIIIAHKHPKTRKVFFSVYAHLQNRLVKKGDRVELGQKIGTVAKAKTAQNGMWQDAHLHFAIYTGPWKNKVLPGYWKKGTKLTKLFFWQAPAKFIKNYKV